MLINRHSPARTAPLAVLLAALLAGCGGGASSAPAPATPPAPLPVPPMPGDAFTAGLVTLVRSAPDATEPVDVDGSTPSMLDDAEPFPVE